MLDVPSNDPEVEPVFTVEVGRSDRGVLVRSDFGIVIVVAYCSPVQDVVPHELAVDELVISSPAWQEFNPE